MFTFTRNYTVEPDGDCCGNCKFFSEHSEYLGRYNEGHCELFHVTWRPSKENIYCRISMCVEAELETKK